MEIAVFGAGKIARGFIACLLQRSGAEVHFFEINRSLTEMINTRKSYELHYFGGDLKETIVNATATCMEDRDKLVQQALPASLFFTAVGGANISHLAPYLADIVRAKLAAGYELPFQIITCENWHQPAKALHDALYMLLTDEEQAYCDQHLGIAESVVLRSCIEPPEEIRLKCPLDVCVQPYWELKVDKDALKSKLPHIAGLKPVVNFGGELTRKIYTYNAASATTSFLGYLKGYSIISEAVRDDEIVSVLKGVYKETSEVLCRLFGFSASDQDAFAQSSFSKLRNRQIVDYVERNARDPIRKLSQTDRLVGPALQAIAIGVTPHHLATAIAAAMLYDHPDDPRAVQLKQIRLERGVDGILQEVIKLPVTSALSLLVKEKLEWLQTGFNRKEEHE